MSNIIQTSTFLTFGLPRREQSLPRSGISLLLLLLFAAACGSTTDTADGTVTVPSAIEDTPPPDQVSDTPPCDAPADDVRDQEISDGQGNTQMLDLGTAWLNVYCTHYASEDVRWHVTTSGVQCPHHVQRLVMLGDPKLEPGARSPGLQDLIEGKILVPVEEGQLKLESQAELGISLWTVDASTTPLAVAQTLAGEGVLATPDYVVLPSPGRMMFPGSLPMLPQSDAIGRPRPPEGNKSGSRIHVLDTGGPEGAREVDRYVTDNAPDAYVAGHGIFIDGLLRALAPGVDIVHWRVNPQDSLIAFESDLAAAALRARANVSEGAMVTNLSMGTTVCDSSISADDPQFAALLTQRVVAGVLLRNDGDHLIAAAGNSGQDLPAFPAAFADGEFREWFAKQLNTVRSGANADLVAVFVDELAEPKGTLTAVGAEPAPPGLFDDPDYSSTGDWITTTRIGCHESTYPNIRYRYPGSSPDLLVDFPGTVEWCGTSFAAPVVTAEIAVALGN